MKTDVLVIGGGLSGLTAASLLAKRGVGVTVVDKSYNPGGSCGIFKRNDMIFDQGSAMLFGFGEKGFNPHRFVFNCLEEPINVIKHDLLYVVNYNGHRIKFWPDVKRFTQELSQVFPDEKANIHRFYHDMNKLYQHVMVEKPVFSTPDETDGKSSLPQLLRHPLSYAKFLSFMNMSTDKLLKRYFKNPDIFQFFDKLTSTYCYTTTKETPAVLAAVMFIDNHVGGSYYPAGSTDFLPGKLEKVIEENGGTMRYGEEVDELVFSGEVPCGAHLNSGEVIYADHIVYSGTVWNLYEKLMPQTTDPQISRLEKQVPTYPSVVLYASVDASVIPHDTAPIEMLVGNPKKIDESEITVYIPSIDDKTLCPPDKHVVMAIGPTFEHWVCANIDEYQEKKDKEAQRIISVLERRFPGFQKAVRFSEVATPKTIERYTNKNGGSVAGPKQLLGQHMLNRQHTKTKWDTLLCCGESTVMGTGTPAVTVSGLSAANAILKLKGLEPYVYRENMKDYVNTVKIPFEIGSLYSEYPDEQKDIMMLARSCLYCEHPCCAPLEELDVRGIMRRVSVGNWYGANQLISQFDQKNQDTDGALTQYENQCVKNQDGNSRVRIKSIANFLLDHGYQVKESC